LLISGFGAAAENFSANEQSKENLGKMDFTHTILAEFATAQTCPYCVFAHGALKNIYASGSFPFYYVTLPLGGKNVHATARAAEYNVYYIPDVFFDGGYKVSCGASDIPSAQATYTSFINQCGARIVKDIDITLDISWAGDAVMDIEVSVDNNEATQYDGHIRVFVTEKVTTMGWLDNSGQPYTFPFLDYAFNEDILISASDTWTDAITWDGHNYNDGYGHNFGNIQENNVMVIAAVYNSEWHQGYSYPPSQYPFDAYYIDEVAGATPGSGVNDPPDTPRYPYPANSETNVPLDLELNWIGGDPNGDDVTYDIYFGTTSQPPKIVSNHPENTYDPGELTNLTTYYWQIVSFDEHDASTTGPIWSFTTSSNIPPSEPNISGPASGNPGEDIEYTFVATDPNSDELQYYIQWGDGTTQDWTSPYASGEEVKLSHQWSSGTYFIKAKVKDSSGAESAYAQLEISIPRYKVVIPGLLQRLLEKFRIFQAIKNFLQ